MVIENFPLASNRERDVIVLGMAEDSVVLRKDY